MPGTHIESFCERCGTKYAFEQPVQRARILKGLGRTLGFLPEEEAAETAAVTARDPFHGLFRFCLECRQYTCPACWNEQAGFCQGCVPLPESRDMGVAEAVAAAEAETHVREALAEIRTLGQAEAWPDADLPQPEVVAAAEPALVYQPLMLVPEAVVDDAEAVKAAEIGGDTATVAAAQPPVVGVVLDDELFAGPWDDDRVLADDVEAVEDWSVLAPELEPVPLVLEAELEVEPEPEPIAAVVAEPEPEPMAAVVAEPEPEPMAAVVAEPEPEAMAAVVAEPEPEPIAAEVAEPEPEPMAAEVAEPEPAPVPDRPEPELPMAAMSAPEPEPVYQLPLAASTREPVVSAPVERMPTMSVEPPLHGASEVPASRLAALFGRSRRLPPEPAPSHADTEPRLASGWRVTAPDETVWPPHAPVYEPPAPPPPASVMAGGRPSLLGPRPTQHQQVLSGIRPCYQCALPLSANARFCRRCGSAQQPGA